MYFLREIGLGQLVENEEKFSIVLHYVVENGKVFRGYRGFYIYHHLGYAEFIVHILPTGEVNEKGEPENVMTGFSSHVMGDWFWHLRIGERGELKDEDEGNDERDPLEICVFFEDDEKRQIPIHLVMADALPSYAPGEFVTLQIAAFTENVHFYPDMETFDNTTGLDLPFGRVSLANGTILNVGIDDSCIVNGPITSVKMLKSFGFDKKTIYILIIMYYNFFVNYNILFNNTDIYINIGKYPLEKNYLIGYDPQSLIDNNIATNIRVKLRQIVVKEFPLKQELIEEDIENIEDKKINNYINHKSKRAKERKIGYIIKKVFMWKTLYNGIYSTDENGNKIKIKYTLEQAAAKAGISKKSLDDYLIQLRIGKFFNFNFTEHKNDKVGILRSFVKKHKQQYEKEKKNLKNENNSSFIGKKRKK